MKNKIVFMKGGRLDYIYWKNAEIDVEEDIDDYEDNEYDNDENHY